MSEQYPDVPVPKAEIEQLIVELRKVAEESPEATLWEAINDATWALSEWRTGKPAPRM